MQQMPTQQQVTNTEARSGTRSADRYLAPDWFSRRVLNRVMLRGTRWGMNLRGARELQVRGRTSGEWRAVPVNPLTIDGETYLVAPRGHTQWVRNLRAAGGEGRLRRGRRTETFTAIELDDEAKPAVIREYLRIWAFEVNRFFDGITIDSTDDELLAVAPGFPVFRLA